MTSTSLADVVPLKLDLVSSLFRRLVQFACGLRAGKLCFGPPQVQDISPEDGAAGIGPLEPEIASNDLGVLWQSIFNGEHTDAVGIVHLIWDGIISERGPYTDVLNLDGLEV